MKPLMFVLAAFLVFISDAAEFDLCCNMTAWAQVTFVARAIDIMEPGFL